KPKPRERPVARSVMTATDVQLPTCEKSASRSAVVISKERLPTKSFLPMESTRFLATSWWPTLHHGPRRVAGRRRTVPPEHPGGVCASVRASTRAVNRHSEPKPRPRGGIEDE